MNELPNDQYFVRHSDNYISKAVLNGKIGSIMDKSTLIHSLQDYGITLDDMRQAAEIFHPSNKLFPGISIENQEDKFIVHESRGLVDAELQHMNKAPVQELIPFTALGATLGGLGTYAWQGTVGAMAWDLLEEKEFLGTAARYVLGRTTLGLAIGAVLGTAVGEFCLRHDISTLEDLQKKNYQFDIPASTLDTWVHTHLDNDPGRDFQESG